MIIFIEIVKALTAGIILGVLFAVIKLPIPAPTSIIGVVGIFGVFIGWWVYIQIFH